MNEVMATEIRTELSKRSEYYIPKHRYLELYHFCLQYKDWVDDYNSLSGLSNRPASLGLFRKYRGYSNPTEKMALIKCDLAQRINLVNDVAECVGGDLAEYLLRGVTEKLSYNELRLHYGIPCCKDVYYKMYRQFFFALDMERD